jgi:hypothetical protein
MTTIDPQRLSDYEFCPRFERLNRTLEPPRLPVREAVKRFFAAGITVLTAPNGIERTAEAFIDAAASPGFSYPSDNWDRSYGNHPATDIYTLANDYCSWLDGALRIAKENYFPGHNLWRVVDRFDERLRWAELLSLAAGHTPTVHMLRLPALRHGRLAHPLSLAYHHPLGRHPRGNYRLAMLDGEGRFNNNWKRLGRWELRDEVSWDEWREWIERDQCMNAIYDYRILEPINLANGDQILADAAALEERMSDPNPPRYQEACSRNCYFLNYCHGSDRDRAEFTTLRTQPSSASLPDPALAATLPPDPAPRGN